MRLKAQYKAERVDTSKNYLKVYVRIEVGTAVRWALIQVPWAMVADHHQSIVENLERIYVAQIEADADVMYLPLEKWE